MRLGIKESQAICGAAGGEFGVILEEKGLMKRLRWTRWTIGVIGVYGVGHLGESTHERHQQWAMTHRAFVSRLHYKNASPQHTRSGPLTRWLIVATVSSQQRASEPGPGARGERNPTRRAQPQAAAPGMHGVDDLLYWVDVMHRAVDRIPHPTKVEWMRTIPQASRKRKHDAPQTPAGPASES